MGIPPCILKGFDADEWVREVWVRDQAGVEVAAEHSSEDEDDEIECVAHLFVANLLNEI